LRITKLARYPFRCCEGKRVTIPWVISTSGRSISKERQRLGILENKIEDLKFLKLYKLIKIELAIDFYDEKDLSTNLNP